MTLYTPIETLHSCLASAQYTDMSEVTDKKRKPNIEAYSGNRSDYDAYQEWIKTAYEKYKRRPYDYELHVEAMFPQTWGDTSLGFGGVGGQSFTTAYTVIIGCSHTYDYCVYFGGRFAYRLDLTKCDIEIIRKDITVQNMAEVRSRGRYLKKKVV